MKKRIHLELRNRTPSDVSRAFLKTTFSPFALRVTCEANGDHMGFSGVYL